MSKIIPQLLPIEKSYTQKLDLVKTNVFKMFAHRGFINNENIEKRTKKLIDNHSEDNEYVLELDNNTNVNSTISNKKIIIKILNYKISSVNKSSEIAEFITKYNNDYKFIIVEAINSKSEKILLSYQTDFEIFKFTELMICIVEHILVPKHMILSQDETNQVLQEYCARKRDMPFIMSNDPVAKFYNMKPGEICKIIRPSVLTCDVPFYRIVIKTNIMRAKT